MFFCVHRAEKKGLLLPWVLQGQLDRVSFSLPRASVSSQRGWLLLQAPNSTVPEKAKWFSSVVGMRVSLCQLPQTQGPLLSLGPGCVQLCKARML